MDPVSNTVAGEEDIASSWHPLEFKLDGQPGSRPSSSGAEDLSTWQMLDTSHVSDSHASDGESEPRSLAEEGSLQVITAELGTDAQTTTAAGSIASNTETLADTVLALPMGADDLPKRTSEDMEETCEVVTAKVTPEICEVYPASMKPSSPLASMQGLVDAAADDDKRNWVWRFLTGLSAKMQLMAAHEYRAMRTWFVGSLDHFVQHFGGKTSALESWTQLDVNVKMQRLAANLLGDKRGNVSVTTVVLGSSMVAACAALTFSLYYNRKLATQLKAKDRELAKLVMRIFSLQEAMQHSRQLPIIRHTSTLGAFAHTML